MKELTNKENLDNERKIRSRKIRKILEKLDVSSSAKLKIFNMYRFDNFKYSFMIFMISKYNSVFPTFIL